MSHSNKFKLLCSWNFPLSTYLSFYLYGDFPPEASTDDALWCRKTMTLVCWLVIVDTICQLHNSILPRDFKSVSGRQISTIYFLSFKICRSNAFCRMNNYSCVQMSKLSLQVVVLWLDHVARGWLESAARPGLPAPQCQCSTRHAPCVLVSSSIYIEGLFMYHRFYL